MKEGTIITLDNEKQYIIVKRIAYLEKQYCLLLSLTEPKETEIVEEQTGKNVVQYVAIKSKEEYKKVFQQMQEEL